MSKTETESESIKCWCGAEGDIDEMFAWDSLDQSCGGTGERNCYCGGDFCVCHFHGSEDCDGCEDCNDQETDEFWDYSDLP